MKTIQNKYIALWERLPEIYPLKTFEEVVTFNEGFREGITELNALIEPYDIPKKIIIFNLLKPIFEKYADAKGFSVKLGEQARKNPDLDGTYKLKLQTGFRCHEGLRKILQDLEYDALKEEGKCNCKLKQKIYFTFRSKPNQDLKFLRITDNYYKMELHQCIECGTYWEYNPGVEDGSSIGWRQISEKNMEQYGLI